MRDLNPRPSPCKGVALPTELIAHIQNQNLLLDTNVAYIHYMSKSTLPNIPILYEDTHILAINKPAGIIVHPDGRSKGPFLTDWILAKYPRAKNVGETMLSPDGEKIIRPGIVHRLDTETSGVLLVAKTKKGHKCLKAQFQDRTIKKKYLAYVWGDLKEEFGTINRPLGRSSSDFRKWSAQRGTRGESREAETYWTRLKNLNATVVYEIKNKKGEIEKVSKNEKFTLIEIEPRTGRTHQIRAHMLAVQHPVVSDSLYAEGKPRALGFERTALHARSIEFTNTKAEKIKVEASLPNDFEKISTIV